MQGTPQDALLQGDHDDDDDDGHDDDDDEDDDTTDFTSFTIFTRQSILTFPYIPVSLTLTNLTNWEHLNDKPQRNIDGS